MLCHRYMAILLYFLPFIQPCFNLPWSSSRVGRFRSGFAFWLAGAKRPTWIPGGSAPAYLTGEFPADRGFDPVRAGLLCIPYSSTLTKPFLVPLYVLHFSSSTLSISLNEAAAKCHSRIKIFTLLSWRVKFEVAFFLNIDPPFSLE